MRSLAGLSRRRISIDQVSRIENIMRTDTSPLRPLHPIFHRKGLGAASVHKNHDLMTCSSQDISSRAVFVKFSFGVITEQTCTACKLIYPLCVHCKPIICPVLAWYQSVCPGLSYLMWSRGSDSLMPYLEELHDVQSSSKPRLPGVWVFMVDCACASVLVFMHVCTCTCWNIQNAKWEKRKGICQNHLTAHNSLSWLLAVSPIKIILARLLLCLICFFERY